MRLIIITLLFPLFYACTERFEPSYSSYSLELHLTLSDSTQGPLQIPEGIDVQFYNTQKDYTLSYTSDTNGILRIESIEAAIYNVNIAQEIKGDKATTYINGSASLTLASHLIDSMALNVSSANNGFLIREYYYSGCETVAGKQYLNDQYVEIYNNGSDTLYADSLLLVELESYGLSTNTFKSIQKDSIVVKTIWATDGTGKDYPIAPGTGFIIAQDAMNHHSDPNGNPNSPVDMGQANFEFWSDKTPDGDIDFAATNMLDKLWVYKGNEFVFHVKGGSAIALVQVAGNVDDYILNNLITKGSATSTSKYYCKINNNNVIDAVEVLINDKLNNNYKRFDNQLDAGMTYIAAGTRSGLCVRRQIDFFVDGRAIYKDTNNSSVDFLHDVVPQPRHYEE